MVSGLRSPRSKGGQARSYHVGNLRERFVREALELLDREGLEMLSLRKVAAAAGVSHAAAYRHFDDKQALLAAVAEEGFGLLYRYQRQVVAECGDDLAARFLNLGWIYVKFAIDHPRHARVMFSGAGLEFRRYPGLQTAAARSFRMLLDVVRRSQERGLMAPGRAKQQTLAAWSMVHGVALLVLDGQIHLRGQPDEVEAKVKSVIGCLHTGLRGPAAPR